MKARYVMVALIINYLCIILFCAFFEMMKIEDTALEINNMIELAADMALEQTQVSDDFFKMHEAYESSTFNAANTKVVSGFGEYVTVPFFQAMTGKTSKEEIYNEIYGKHMTNFVNSVPNVLDIEGTVSNYVYYDTTGVGINNFYKVPRITQVGLEYLGGTDALRAYAANDARVTDNNVLQSIAENYKLYNAKKEVVTASGTEEYYVTPLSLGITYINEDVLQYNFMNNLDLLMRVKYAKEGKNLNSKEGGLGVLETPYLADAVAVNNSNPINNGKFTLLRGQAIHSSYANVDFYRGVMPRIKYKVIDMFDPANDALLVSIFGAKNTVSGSRALYFKEAASDVIDAMTGLPAEKKPIVVAEVTFYADVIVPLTTPCLREMRVHEDSTGLLRGWAYNTYTSNTVNNFVDIVRTGLNGSGVQGGLGNNSDCIVYTKLFAVVPHNG